MTGSRIPAIMLKEVQHILRDPRTLFIVFLLPILQLVIFGYAMNMEIRHIRLAVYDYCRSQTSRALVDRFAASQTFEVSQPAAPSSRMQALFAAGAYDAAIVIPKDFDIKRLQTGNAKVQLVIDASDPNAATLIRAYCQSVIAAFPQMERFAPLSFSSSMLYNPDLKSAFFFVPALVAMILIMISALLTSITITREKELGTLEQILVSPVKSHELIIGKVLPYILLALIDALFILAVGVLIFQVPFRGSFLTFLLFTLFYILTALSLGLLISTVAKAQMTAMMMAVLITLLPTLMLSGFIFPVASLPRVLQYISYIVPARYYLQIIRGVMLKGNTLSQLLQPALALGLMTLLMLTVAIRRFSLRLK